MRLCEITAHQTCSLVFSCVHIANVFRHHGLRLQLGQWTIWDWLCIEKSQIVNQSEHGYSWDNYGQFISYISVHGPGVMCKQHISYTVYSILKSITFLRCETGTKSSDWPKEARLDFDILLTHISDSDAMWWLAINGLGWLAWLQVQHAYHLRSVDRIRTGSVRELIMLTHLCRYFEKWINLFDS